MPPRNNYLNHFSKYSTSKKCLTDFIDSFDKLKEILDERARKSSQIDGNLNSIENELPFAHVDDDQEKNQTNLANQENLPMKLQSEKNPGDQEMNSEKDTDIMTKNKKINSNVIDSYENDGYSLGKDVFCLIQSLEQCKNKNIPIRDLLEYYNNLDKKESTLIAKFTKLSKDKKNLKKSEHLNNLYMIINCKKILRAEIGKIFVRMISQNIQNDYETENLTSEDKKKENLSSEDKNLSSDDKNLSSDGKNLSSDGKSSTADGKNLTADDKNLTSEDKNLIADDKKNITSLDDKKIILFDDSLLLIRIRDNFLPLFSPKELYTLYLSFLSLRRKKMVHFFTNKLSLFLIRQLIEREISQVWQWFSNVIKIDITTQLNQSKEINKSVITNKHSHKLDFNTLTAPPSNELQILRFFIFSLVRKAVCHLNEQSLLTQIEILTDDQFTDCKIRLLTNLILKDVLKEIRDKRLQMDGILEL